MHFQLFCVEWNLTITVWSIPTTTWEEFLLRYVVRLEMILLLRMRFCKAVSIVSVAIP